MLVRFAQNYKTSQTSWREQPIRCCATICTPWIAVHANESQLSELLQTQQLHQQQEKELEVVAALMVASMAVAMGVAAVIVVQRAKAQEGVEVVVEVAQPASEHAGLAQAWR